MQSIKGKLQSNKYVYWVSLTLISLVFVAVSAFAAKFIIKQFSGSSSDILVTTPGSCELTFEVGHTTPTTDAEITKVFKTTEGADLGLTPVNPLQKVVAEITIKNIGNTELTNLTIEDYLDDTFIAKGAQNLDLISFKNFVDNPGDICTYTDSTKLISCSPISLLPDDTFTFSYTVELTDNLGISKNVVNVACLSNSESSIYKCADDEFPTQVVSNICNFDSGLCEEVLRDKETGETACNVDNDCVTDTPTHFQCVDQSCSIVDGEGTNTCSTDSDCSYSTCEEESCVEKTCTSGDCESSCTTNSDCSEPTRLICKDQSCIEVNGEGSDLCDSDSDCVYFRCNDQDKCIPETCENGDCESSCDSDGDCKDENYRICRDERCVEVSGKGDDECDADIDCEVVEYTSPETPQTPSAPVVAQTVPQTGTDTILERSYLALVGASLVYAGFLISRRFRKND